MTIGIILSLGAEHVEVRVQDSSVLFRTLQFQQFVTIDYLRLEKKGVIKEFPDLENNEDWEKIARERFKEKMKSMTGEMQRVKYIVSELTKFGYIPRFINRDGHRPVKLY